MVRLKNRFLICQLMLNGGSKEKFNDLAAKDIQLALRDKISELFGDFGAGEFGSSTQVKIFESQFTKFVVIRTTRDNQHEAHLAVSSISRMKDVDITLRSLAVHSCPRTCLKSLKDLLSTYFTGIDLKDVDKAVAENTIVKMFDTVEL